MNANLLPKTLPIEVWVNTAAGQLVNAGIASGRLDAEIILAHTLRKSRTYLHAYPDETIPARERDIADVRIQLRLDRTPIAYIIGHKEFYGRRFRVTPATLVPRPESEMIITLLKELHGQNLTLFKDIHRLRLIDVGTGTGCLGVTAKLELPGLDVTLLDNSHHALKVAQTNVEKLSADVTILHSDLLSDYPMQAHFILANLPYVDESWEHSPEVEHEPKGAVFAKDHGLALMKECIIQAKTTLANSGLALFEADPRQHQALTTFAKSHGLRKVTSRDFVIVFRKA